MRLYQQSITVLQEELQKLPCKELKVEEGNWTVYDQPQLLLKSETAYELGGEEKEAVSGVAFVMEPEEASVKDQILLYGPDLPEIKQDCDYARFAVITLKKETLQSGENAYRLLRKIEYTRYHTHPKGFMMRISASQGREPVRIGKKELSENMTFQRIGNAMLKQYHKHKEVAAVQLIFVTNPSFSYRNARKISAEMEKMTGSMEEVFQKLTMDCGSCSLKEICDTVEGMKELHFGLQS